MSKYEFLPDDVRKQLPPLFGQEKVKDPIVYVKFFVPWGNWTWYAYEFDGEDTFFGWVVGFEKELGYFSLSELQSVTGPAGLKIERDLYFDPTPLSQVMAKHGETAPSIRLKRDAAPMTIPKGRCYKVFRLSDGKLMFAGNKRDALGEFTTLGGSKAGYIFYFTMSETMPRRAPQLFIDHGIISGNGGDEGMPLPFNQAEHGWMQWQGRLGEHLVTVKVTGITHVFPPILKAAFSRSEAIISPRVIPGRDLPFSAAGERKVWWMATFEDGPMTIEVSNIFGLRTSKLEDAFADSTARIYSKRIVLGTALQTIHLYGTPTRKYIDEMQKLHRSDSDEFYRRKKEVRKAIQERERGKIKALQGFSLTELRQIMREVNMLYG